MSGTYFKAQSEDIKIKSISYTEESDEDFEAKIEKLSLYPFNSKDDKSPLDDNQFKEKVESLSINYEKTE